MSANPLNRTSRWFKDKTGKWRFEKEQPDGIQSVADSRTHVRRMEAWPCIWTMRKRSSNTCKRKPTLTDRGRMAVEATYRHSPTKKNGCG